MAINKRIIKSNDEAAGGASFNTVIYSGNGTGQSIDTVGFAPDLVWVKNRLVANFHILSNTVSGANKQLYTNTTDSEQSDPGFITGFNIDGFDVGDSPSTNTSGTDNMVAWCWRAGGAAVTNTDGTITSQVSANTEAGFSIVSWTGNSLSGSTVGHGLSDTPKMIIVKSRNEIGGSSKNWTVYSEEIGNTQYLYLNTTAAASVYNFWNNTSPTNSVFSLSSDTNVNSSVGNYIAYCFAEVAGFSKFGSYTGNGNGSYDSTGTVVAQTITTGFEPAFVMIKRTDATEHWMMFDNKRGGSSPGSEWKTLYANLSNAEADFTYGGGYSALVDFTSDGFTLGNDPSATVNFSGGTYIYMAFANQF